MNILHNLLSTWEVCIHGNSSSFCFLAKLVLLFCPDPLLASSCSPKLNTKLVRCETPVVKIYHLCPCHHSNYCSSLESYLISFWFKFCHLCPRCGPSYNRVLLLTSVSQRPESEWEAPKAALLGSPRAASSLFPGTALMFRWNRE